jgi:hypothetical protein
MSEDCTFDSSSSDIFADDDGDDKIQITYVDTGNLSILSPPLNH